jgi:radical SAM protein with 4Fe4S-binding SPASM domain
MKTAAKKTLIHIFDQLCAETRSPRRQEIIEDTIKVLDEIEPVPVNAVADSFEDTIAILNTANAIISSACDRCNYEATCWSKCPIKRGKSILGVYINDEEEEAE